MKCPIMFVDKNHGKIKKKSVILALDMYTNIMQINKTKNMLYP